VSLAVSCAVRPSWSVDASKSETRSGDTSTGILRFSRSKPRQTCADEGFGMSKPGGGNVTEPRIVPTSSGRKTGDRTTDLKRPAAMSGTGIHRLIYRDICVAVTAHNTGIQG